MMNCECWSRAHLSDELIDVPGPDEEVHICVWYSMCVYHVMPAHTHTQTHTHNCHNMHACHSERWWKSEWVSSPFSNAENTDEFLECIKCYIRSLPFHISTYIPTGLLTPRDLYQRSTCIYGTYAHIYVTWGHVIKTPCGHSGLTRRTRLDQRAERPKWRTLEWFECRKHWSNSIQHCLKWTPALWAWRFFLLHQCCFLDHWHWQVRSSAQILYASSG